MLFYFHFSLLTPTFLTSWIINYSDDHHGKNLKIKTDTGPQNLFWGVFQNFVHLCACAKGCKLSIKYCFIFSTTRDGKMQFVTIVVSNTFIRLFIFWKEFFLIVTRGAGKIIVNGNFYWVGFHFKRSCLSIELRYLSFSTIKTKTESLRLRYIVTGFNCKSSYNFNIKFSD